ncbi:DUF1800 domain-containing protein [Flavobacterium franklandianum]|uniref:DUF1800 domain-containing protein n=1 Tax=Flavobacterium franklandianum TaxID=2594430 RepID=A0A553CRB8_9FLAO|nr:DUF1800 domain-containing protein [Flavobacterium franklandianum]TRX23082.1 DUF1800 domain-containing protein [Flavobacterium franklandianum]
MDKNTLWSLRLGYSAKQANTIEKTGLKKFLELSFDTKVEYKIPNFLENSPKSFQELKEIRKTLNTANPEAKKEMLKKEVQTSFEMKAWWIDKMVEDEFPLREKMTCFWHNHYVSTFQKVKVNYWVFQHNQILRENAFGNFKSLTKKIIQSNAMVRYLDNVDNRKDKLNENLSRELLELFTLGIGNYTEDDIKNGAKGLAGLGVGEENAVYRKIFEDNNSFVYFGKKGNFKIDEMIDIIFEQPNIAYLITRKILKWFIYDNPKEELVHYYGDYFKKMKFEIQPLLIKIFTEEFAKNNVGSKIKNPLEYSLQLMDELNVTNPNAKLIAFFIKEQGMDLFNQPNVKGWDGGNSWLTSQVFLQRNNVADLLCNGKNIARVQKEMNKNSIMRQNSNRMLNVKLNWDKKGNNKEIIAELKNRLLFQTDESDQLDFEQILKYDFDSKTEGSENAVLRLFNFMVKTPEFQLI